MAESLGTSVLDLTTDDTKLTSGMESAKGTAKKLGLAIGVAAGVAITAGAVEGIRREALGDQLAAQLDLTGQQSERAGRIAGGLYADAYGDSLEQVNSALAGIHSNIGELGTFSDAEITDMGEHALNLAKIMGEDVSRVTRGVGQLMRNDLAPNAQAAFDIIFAAQSKVGEDMKGELLDTIEEYSADFASLGLTGEQSMAMIVAAVQNGARNTDLAADAVREFSIRAVDGSTLTTEAFSALGLDAEAMAAKIAAGGPTARAAMSQVIGALAGVGSEVEQEAIGVALFGTRFEEMGIDAITAMDPAAAGLDNMAGAADRMGDTLNDNAQTKIAGFKRSIEGALASVVEAPGILGDGAAAAAGFGQALAPIGPAVSGVAFLFGGAIKRMVSATVLGTGRMIAAMSVTVARVVAGWVLMAVQSLIQAARMAIAWIIAMGPIGLIIAAVVGLVALIIANWDTVKKFTIAIFTAVWNWLKGLWDKIVGFIGKAIGFVKDIFFKFHPVGIIIRNWEPIWRFITGLFDRVLKLVKSIPGKIASRLSGMWDALKAGLRGVLNGAISLINGAIGGINTLIRTANKIPGVSIPTISSIPHLAKGGIVTDPTLALLGEAGAEAVIPLPSGFRPGDGASLFGDDGGVRIENLNVQAWSDRFSLRQIEDELSLHGAA